MRMSIVKGQKTKKCTKLKNYIQDIIDKGDIEV